MPRKDKEAYNQYMKEYYRQKRTMKKIENTEDFTGSEESRKPEVITPPSSADPLKDLMDQVNNMATDPVTGKEDPTLKTIKTIVKYLPVAMEFIKGFKEAAKMDLSRQQPMQQREEPKIRPPEGWLHMSPLEKLKFKYSRPEWYEAGVLYDQAQGGGSGIDISGSSGGSKKSPPRNAASPSENPPPREPKTLKELADKYPEPPIVENGVDPEETAKEGDVEMPGNDIVKILQRDNERYALMACEKINSMSDEEIIKYLEDVEGTINTFNRFKVLLPAHLVQMIIELNKPILDQLLQSRCKAKYDMLVEKEKIDKVFELFERIQQQVKP